MTAATTPHTHLAGFSALIGQKGASPDIESLVPQKSFWQTGVDWVSAASSKAASVALGFFGIVSAWTKDTDAISGTLDKLQTHVIVWVRHATEIPEHLGKLQTELKNVVGIIDFMLLLNEIKYFVKQKWRDDSAFSIGAHVTGTFARVCIGLNFLKDLGFLNLAKAANAIGQSRPLAFVGATLNAVKDWPLFRSIPKLGEFAAKVGDLRLFSFVAKLSIDRVILSALMCTFAFTALEAIRAMVSTTNSYLQTSSFLAFLNSLSELALGTLVLFGSATPVALGVVGATAAILGLTKFAYDTCHVNELNAAKKQIKIKV